MHSPCAPQLGGVCADEIDGIIATLEQRVHRLEEVQDEAKREMLGDAIGKEEACWVPSSEDGGEGNAAASPPSAGGCGQATTRGTTHCDGEGTALLIHDTMCRRQQHSASEKQGCVDY